MSDRRAPAACLRLSWIHGYRGHQCRNNLWYNNNRHLVYFVAAVGVVCDPREPSQRFFLGHDDDIICLSLHPQLILAASGQIGKEPFICVWDTNTLQPLSILKNGHTHGVGAVAFNSNGSLLVSVGLDENSTIVAWDWAKGRIIASVRGHSDRIFDVQFNPSVENSIVSCGIKHIKFWTLKGNALIDKRGVFGKTGEIQTMLCLAFGANAALYAGTLSGDIYIWKNNVLDDVITEAHAGSVITMHKSDEGYVTAGKDGVLRLWDMEFNPIIRLDLSQLNYGYTGICVRSVCWRSDYILVGTQNSEILEVSPRNEDARLVSHGHSEGELWGLAVHPHKLIYATASDDCTIRQWSVLDNRLLCQSLLPAGARSCAFNSNGTHLAVGLKDGSFVVLLSSDMTEVIHVKDRKEVIHEMKYSPDGTYLAVGSNDNFVDIYNVVKGYRRVGQCLGCSSFITHLDWSTNSIYVQVNSGAGERLIYKAPDGKQVVSRDEVNNAVWSTWTGVLGNEVSGIWPKYADKSGVNAADVHFGADVVVTGDDFGLVKLFRFPCYRKGAKFHQFKGHSAHVTNVRFTCDKAYVISTGGADHAVFQWQFSMDRIVREIISEPVHDSLSDATDSDLSDVGALDSDLEDEKQINYDRHSYKEDLLEKYPPRVLNGPIEKRQKPPEDGLMMEFVFGYRGHDCRNNVLFTQDGDVVYHVAALGIVYARESHKQKFYSQHTDDILCLCVHPTKDFVATGQVGRNPSIHVWDANTMKTISIMQGHHHRGVAAVDFSGDGKKLVSIGLDDSHTIVVWDWKKGELMSFTRGHKDKLFVVKWNPHDSCKLVTVGINHIKFWTQVGGGFTSSRGVFNHIAKAETMLCVVHGKFDVCYSGGISGAIFEWEKNYLKRTIQAHRGPLFSMHALDKGFVSGGKDGSVSLWDEYLERCLRSYPITNAYLFPGSQGRLVRDNPPVRSCVLGHAKILVGTKYGEVLELDKGGLMRILVQGHADGELWGLATHPSRDWCITASDDKTLRIWDFASGHMVCCHHLAGKARCVAYSPDGRAVAVGFNDGSFSVMSSDTAETYVRFHHRQQQISDVKFSPDGKYLAVACHDNFVDIYHVPGNKRTGICYGNSSYASHIDWEKSGKLLQVNSGARERLFFEIPRGKRQCVAAAALKQLEWATWTSVLGDLCEGIWSPNSRIADINCTSRSRDGRLLATGDNFGFIKLFEFPVRGKHSKYKKYCGHSAHVTNVRWSYDDRHLMSTGGADNAVIVWCRSGALCKMERHLGQGDSEESDTDEEVDQDNDGGYESDVEKEKLADFTSKICRHDGQGLKPHDREINLDSSPRVTVDRSLTLLPKLKHTGDLHNKVKGQITDLTLEHVHGYRGYDCRNNLHYINNANDIVFHAAGIGVVQNLLTNHQSFYLGHSDDLISLTVNRNPHFRGVVATGQIGSNPTVHVWHCNDLSTLSILQVGHDKGVGALDFSANGKLLITVGVNADHTVAVWKWQEGIKIASRKGHRERVFSAQFRPESESQFVSVGVKNVKFWTVVGGLLKYQRGIVATDGSSKTCLPTMLSIAFGANDATFTGASTGDVYVWHTCVLQRIVAKAHEGPIFSLFTTLYWDGLVVSGAKERENDDVVCVKLWDADMKRCKPYPLGTSSSSIVVKSVCRDKGKILVGTKDNSIYEIEEKTGIVQLLQQSHGEGELWGSAVHPTKPKFVTAGDDSTLRVWDILSKRMLVKVTLPAGGRCVHYSTDGEFVAVGLKNGELLILTSSNMKVWSKRRDRTVMINDIKFCPNGKYLAVGYQDWCVDFYDLTQGSQIRRAGTCKGIPSFVTNLDFSADSAFVRVCTANYQQVCFSVPRGNPVKESVSLDITWATWSSSIDSSVVGIWPRSADRGDVNCCDVTRYGATLATGDDFGYVKLFDFPCPEKFAKYKKYTGHSAHVTSVRFSNDDRYLISTGGHDACACVWKTAINPQF